MNRFLTGIFDTSRYSSPLDANRAHLVYIIATALLLLLSSFLILSPLSGRFAWTGNAIDGGIFATLFATSYVGLILSIVLTRYGHADAGSVIVVFLMTSVIGALVVGDGGYTITDGMAIIVILAFSSLMLRHYGIYVGLASSLLITVLSINQRLTLPLIPPNNTYDMFVSIIFVGAAASLFYGFQRFARIARSEGAAVAQQDRLKLAQITTEISQRISRRLALNEVLRDAVEQMRESYPTIYHAQIFLIDDTRQNARLVASTGEVGKMLIERQHSLPVGSQSVIGQVTARRKPIVTRANAGDGIHRRNEFLPDTVVEAAFPMLIGDTVIGALDLQSKTDDAFADDEVPIFQALADNIAIAIDNARLFEETEKRLRENQMLMTQTEEAASEVERLNQRLTGQFWEDYLMQQTSTSGLNIDLAEQSSHPDNVWTPGLQQAISRNESVKNQQADKQIISVPLRVRGQAVGAMEFELADNNPLAAEDIAMIEEVSEQLGLAAESNRLFETSQRMAQREALVNEIATRLQSSNNVEMTLNAAAHSLKEVLKANRVVIRLGTPPAVGENGGRA